MHVDQIYGVCPVCNKEIMRSELSTSQCFGYYTFIHFACHDTWWRVIGAWHAELARQMREREQEPLKPPLTRDEAEAIKAAHDEWVKGRTHC